MVVESFKYGPVLLLKVNGRVDGVTAPKLQTVFESHVAGGARRVVIDLSLVDFVSSAGLRVLLLATKQLKPINGKLVISGARQSLLDLFQMSGFVKMLILGKTEAESIALANA